MNYTITPVHISTIIQGDTVINKDGHMATVCKKDIKYGGFCGCSLFGDSYKLGREPVSKVIFNIPTNLGVRS